MATYGSTLRHCTKWYRKLAFEIIWGTSLVNTHFFYNEYSTKNILTITEFREQIIQALFERISSGDNADLQAPSSGQTDSKHNLIQKNVEGKKVCGRCVECYKIYGRYGYN